MPGLDPVSMGVSGVAALVTSILDAQAKNAGIAQAQQGLNFQKTNADRQYRLGTSTRTDAYGNEQYYDPTSNKWVTKLSPMQERLVQSGQREQLLSLTDDAARNRDVRERAFRRGQGADEDFTKTRAAFNYKRPPSEGSIESELLSLLSGSAQGAAARGDADAGTQALRSGLRQPNARRSSENVGSTLSDIILKARQGAMGESASRESAHNSQYLPVLQGLQQTASGGGDAPTRFSDTPQQLSGQQDSMAKLIQTALASGGQGVGAADKNLSNLMFKAGPDAKGMASLISAISGNSLRNGVPKTNKTPDATVPIGTTGDTNWWDDLSSGANLPF